MDSRENGAQGMGGAPLGLTGRRKRGDSDELQALTWLLSASTLTSSALEHQGELFQELWFQHCEGSGLAPFPRVLPRQGSERRPFFFGAPSMYCAP